MVKLVEVFRGNGMGRPKIGFTLREIYVNPSHVSCMYEDVTMENSLREGYLPDELDERQSFTKIQLSQGQTFHYISVVGDVDSISEKLGLSLRRRQLLHD